MRLSVMFAKSSGGAQKKVGRTSPSHLPPISAKADSRQELPARATHPYEREQARRYVVAIAVPEVAIAAPSEPDG